MAKKVLPRVQAMVLCDGLKESDEEPDVFTLKGVRSVVEKIIGVQQLGACGRQKKQQAKAG